MADNLQERPNDQVFFTMVEQMGVLSMHDSGWNREVNIVAWNGRPAKIDIRDWSPGHKRMSKGITLTEEEALRMSQILIRRLDPNGRKRSNMPLVRPPQTRYQSGEENQSQPGHRQRPQRSQQLQTQSQCHNLGLEENDAFDNDSFDMGAARADILWDETEDTGTGSTQNYKEQEESFFAQEGLPEAPAEPEEKAETGTHAAADEGADNEMSDTESERMQDPVSAQKQDAETDILAA